MTQVTKRKLVREILLQPRFLKLKYIGMAIDYSLDRDRKEDRYSHSIEVANSCEVISDNISKKLGLEIDYRNAGYIVGLLHDIGHTAFGHEGEQVLNLISKDKGFSFNGNSNNYIVIERYGFLNKVEDKDYILASLAKHPGDLYSTQEHIKRLIEKSVKEDKEFLEKNGLKATNIKKTIQCQVMDIADENCYIISDLIDSLNILTYREFCKILRKELNKKIAEDIILSIYKSKKSFVDKMQKYFYLFSENFILENGIIIPENEEIEEIRKSFAKINRKYILGNKKIKKIRKQNKVVLKKVFSFYMENKNIDLIPSKFYRRELSKAKNKEEFLILIRDMLGSLTDKGIKKLYRRINK